jgi:hypothetical protein
MNRQIIWIGVLGALLAAHSGSVWAQMPSIGINPMRMEIEVKAGAEKTVAFDVTAGASNSPERGRLLLSLTDWNIQEDGTVSFLPLGSSDRSASPWVLFSPSALTMEPGRSQLVRLTVTVPADAAPGAYRTAVFLQERPPAASPAATDRKMYVRVRYTVILHVIVPPVLAHPDLVNVDVDTSQSPVRLICELTNTGNLYVRPIIVWKIKRQTGDLLQGKAEATMLLPGSKTREPIPLPGVDLQPGHYDAEVLIDFQDGSPQQSMSRAFEVQSPPEPPAEQKPLAQ